MKINDRGGRTNAVIKNWTRFEIRRREPHRQREGGDIPMKNLPSPTTVKKKNVRIKNLERAEGAHKKKGGETNFGGATERAQLATAQYGSWRTDEIRNERRERNAGDMAGKSRIMSWTPPLPPCPFAAQPRPPSQPYYIPLYSAREKRTKLAGWVWGEGSGRGNYVPGVLEERKFSPDEGGAFHWELRRFSGKTRVQGAPSHFWPLIDFHRHRRSHLLSHWVTHTILFRNEKKKLFALFFRGAGRGLGVAFGCRNALQIFTPFPSFRG